MSITNLPAVQILLKGGPLDGEIQVVQSTRTDPHHVLRFNIATHQSFDENGDVITKGLVVDYVFSGEIPLEQGGHFDDQIYNTFITDDYWQHNYLYTYAGPEGSYVPLPAPIQPLPPVAGIVNAFGHPEGHSMAYSQVLVLIPKIVAARSAGRSLTQARLTALTPILLNGMGRGRTGAYGALYTPSAFTMGRSTFAYLDTFEHGLPKLLRSSVYGTSLVRVPGVVPKLLGGPALGRTLLGASMSPYVNSTSNGYSLASGGTVTSGTLNVPSSPVVGNLLVAFVYAYTNPAAVTMTPPSGWVQVAYTQSGTLSGMGIYTRVIDGTESASYTWGFSAASWWAGAMLQFLPSVADGNAFKAASTSNWSTTAFTSGDSSDTILVALGTVTSTTTVVAGTAAWMLQRVSTTFGNMNAADWVWETRPGLTAIQSYGGTGLSAQPWQSAALALKPIAWSPASASSTLVAWWDASQITGQADNTLLSSWPVAGGTGGSSYAMAQATSANRPTYYSSTAGKLINGKPAVWFSGNQWMRPSATPPSVAQPITFCLVCGVQTVTGTQVFLDGAVNPGRFGVYFTGGQYNFNFMGVFSGGYTMTANQHLLMFTSDTGGAGIYIDSSSSPGASGTFGTGSPIPFTFGADYTNAAQLTGYICEVAVYTGTALSATDRINWLNYARNKWGTP